MKRVLIIIMALGLILGFASTDSVVAGQPSNASLACFKFCAEFPDDCDDLGFWSHGDCVSFLQTVAVVTCKEAKEAEQLEDLGYKNLGQCISDLKHQIKQGIFDFLYP